MSRVILWTKKILVYCMGMFLCACGVSIALLSNLGISPVSSFPYVLSVISGVSLGTMITIVYCVFILLQFVLLRKNFHIINILQIVCSVIFGLFVDVTDSLAQSIIGAPSNYGISLVMLVSSIILIGIGVTLYMNAGIVLLPAEGLMKAIATVAGLKTSTAKVIFDITLVTISVILSFVFLGKLEGVREGTIITACCVGLVMKVLDKVVGRQLSGFLSECSTAQGECVEGSADTVEQ